MIQPLTMVDHFEVLRQIDRGGRAVVYLARDTRLGRKIALKVFTGRDQLVDRQNELMAEARAIARLNHPNIISIFAVGEHDGAPYLALEYLEGETLRRRMSQALGQREAIRLALAVARALEHAHAQGVLHRDLKPENVLIGADGRVRLLDFGLASLGGPEPTDRLRGTPAYMAPEQWTRDPPTPASDLWAFGVMLQELLTGARPFHDVPRGRMGEAVTNEAPAPPGDLPPALRRLIRRCLSRSFGDRHTASEVCEVLEESLHHARPARARCPFPGLRAFTEADTWRFHGRDADLAAFVERLRDEVVLPLVGPSGAGKTSFLGAGVIPRIHEQGQWTVLSLRPGVRPMRALAEQIVMGQGQARSSSGFDEQADKLADLLVEAPGMLSLILEQLARDRSSESETMRVLLIVDQLEELAVLEQDAVSRERFLEAICTGADDPDGPVRVILSLREDFLGRLSQLPAARAALSALAILQSPTEQELRQILARPLEGTGYRFEAGALVDEIVQAVAGERGSLPLVQFAARMLWDRRSRDDRLLRQEDYRSFGGVAGALATHADGVLAPMSDVEVGIARQLLLRLVTSEGTRRTLAREDALRGLGVAGERVLTSLTDGRIVAIHRAQGADREQAPADPGELELVHESLIRRWATLSRWYQQSREGQAVLEELEQAAALWDRRGRRSEELWRRDALAESSGLLRRRDDISPLAATFVAASRRRVQAAGRRRRVTWISLGAFAAIGLIVLVFLARRDTHRHRAEAVTQREEATRQWRSAQLAGARSAAHRGDRVRARALVRAVLELGDSDEGRVLWWRLQGERLLWRHRAGAPVNALAFSSRGHVAAAGPGPVRLITAATRDTRILGLAGSRAGSLPGPRIKALVFSPDGTRLAGGTDAGGIVIWSIPDGAIRLVRRRGSAVVALAFSRDGKTLAAGTSSGRIQLVSAVRGSAARELRGSGAPVTGLSFSPDGGALAAASGDRSIRIWAPTEGKVVKTFEGHGAVVLSVSFRPDGRQLASGDQDGVIRLWSPRTGVADGVLTSHAGGVASVEYSPDGQRLLTASPGSPARIWALRTGTTVDTLCGTISGGAAAARFGPSGDRAVTAGRDGTIRLWRVGDTSRPRVDRGHRGPVSVVALDPGGKRLASVGADLSDVWIWDVDRGRRRRLVGHTGPVLASSFSAGGRLLATAGVDRSVRIWNPATGAADRVLTGHAKKVFAVRFGPDDAHVISAGADRSIRIWDLATGESRVLSGHGAPVLDLATTPGGSLLASAGADGDIRLWRLPGGAAVARLAGHRARVTSVSFSPDGRTLASGSDGHIRIWDVAGRSGEALPLPAGRAVRLTFVGPDRLALASAGHPPKICTLRTRRCIPLEGGRGDINGLSFTRARGGTLAAARQDASVGLWRAADGAALWRAPGGVGVWITSIDILRRTRVARARAAALGPKNSVCLWSRDGHLERWSGAGSGPRWRRPVAALDRLAATRDGCLTLGDGAAVLHLDSGPRRLHGKAQAIAAGGDPRRAVLVAAGDSVLTHDDAGALTGSRKVDVGMTALLPLQDHLAVGFADGSIEVHPAPGAGPAVRMRVSSASPVDTLAAGPCRTLFSGHRNGELHGWRRGGARFYDAKLHGSVRLLKRRGQTLVAGTTSGDHLRLDLSSLELAYCELLRQIWRDASVVLERGRVVTRGPPGGHRCRPR